MIDVTAMTTLKNGGEDPGYSKNASGTTDNPEQIVVRDAVRRLAAIRMSWVSNIIRSVAARRGSSIGVNGFHRGRRRNP